MARSGALLAEAQWKKIAPLLPQPPKQRKGTKWMVVVDGAGVPLGDHLYSASPAEVKLAETTLAAIRVSRLHGAGPPGHGNRWGPAPRVCGRTPPYELPAVASNA